MHLTSLLRNKEHFRYLKKFQKTKSYPQFVHTVRQLLYILWRTNNRTQYVDKTCGYVHNSCGQLVCKFNVKVDNV